MSTLSIRPSGSILPVHFSHGQRDLGPTWEETEMRKEDTGEQGFKDLLSFIHNMVDRRTRCFALF